MMHKKKSNFICILRLKNCSSAEFQLNIDKLKRAENYVASRIYSQSLHQPMAIYKKDMADVYP
jgi:hypothetical protein